MIVEKIEDLIGKTPIFHLNRLERKEALHAHIYAKLEYLNSTGSVKDRAAKEMLDEAERTGKLCAGGTIIEPTSGNTGIAFASLASERGYKCIIVMPETMSVERQKIMKAYGATLILTSGKEGMAGAVERAREELKKHPHSFMPNQFENPSNVIAHEKTTAKEIWQDMAGKVDIFIAGVGTGGTITGCSHYLKSKNPAIKVIAVEPASSAVLSGKEKGAHKIQGIGAGFVPKILDTSCYDEVSQVTDADAISQAATFGSIEGLLVGISSGAALYAAVQEAKKEENEGKNIIVILPDGAGKYLSTALFSNF